MWEDPIVAEVHRAREKLAADCNYDVEAFFAGVRKRQALLGARLVPQKNEPNQRLKLTGAAIPVLRGPRPPRRPRQLRLTPLALSPRLSQSLNGVFLLLLPSPFGVIHWEACHQRRTE